MKQPLKNLAHRLVYTKYQFVGWDSNKQELAYEMVEMPRFKLYVTLAKISLKLFFARVKAALKRG